MKATKYKQNKLGVRPDTYQKYQHVAGERRWTLSETADAVIDDFMERNAPDSPSASQKRRKEVEKRAAAAVCRD